MKNVLKVDTANTRLVMDRTFAAKAMIAGSEEYNLLQAARRDYPTFSVVQRKIKRNVKKETYPGLNYKRMEAYIATRPDAEVRLQQFEELKELTAMHRVKYPQIKKWFLASYPEVVQYGMQYILDNSAALDETI